MAEDNTPTNVVDEGIELFHSRAKREDLPTSDKGLHAGTYNAALDKAAMQYNNINFYNWAFDAQEKIAIAHNNLVDIVAGDIQLELEDLKEGDSILFEREEPVYVEWVTGEETEYIVKIEGEITLENGEYINDLKANLYTSDIDGYQGDLILELETDLQYADLKKIANNPDIAKISKSDSKLLRPGIDSQYSINSLDIAEDLLEEIGTGYSFLGEQGYNLYKVTVKPNAKILELPGEIVLVINGKDVTWTADELQNTLIDTNSTQLTDIEQIIIGDKTIQIPDDAKRKDVSKLLFGDYDVITYKNQGEDVGSKSYLFKDSNSYTIEKIDDVKFNDDVNKKFYGTNKYDYYSDKAYKFKNQSTFKKYQVKEYNPNSTFTDTPTNVGDEVVVTSATENLKQSIPTNADGNIVLYRSTTDPNVNILSDFTDINMSNQAGLGQQSFYAIDEMYAYNYSRPSINKNVYKFETNIKPNQVLNIQSPTNAQLSVLEKIGITSQDLKNWDMFDTGEVNTKIQNNLDFLLENNIKAIGNNKVGDSSGVFDYEIVPIITEKTQTEIKPVSQLILDPNWEGTDRILNVENELFQSTQSTMLAGKYLPIDVNDPNIKYRPVYYVDEEGIGRRAKNFQFSEQPIENNLVRDNLIEVPVDTNTNVNLVNDTYVLSTDTPTNVVDEVPTNVIDLDNQVVIDTEYGSGRDITVTVDKDGNVVLFRGTDDPNRGINVDFESQVGRGEVGYGKGNYFSPNPQYAANYAQPSRRRLYGYSTGIKPNEILNFRTKISDNIELAKKLGVEDIYWDVSNPNHQSFSYADLFFEMDKEDVWNEAIGDYEVTKKSKYGRSWFQNNIDIFKDNGVKAFITTEVGESGFTKAEIFPLVTETNNLNIKPVVQYSVDGPGKNLSQFTEIPLDTPNRPFGPGAAYIDEIALSTESFVDNLPLEKGVKDLFLNAADNRLKRIAGQVATPGGILDLIDIWEIGVLALVAGAIAYNEIDEIPKIGKNAIIRTWNLSRGRPIDAPVYMGFLHKFEISEYDIDFEYAMETLGRGEKVMPYDIGIDYVQEKAEEFEGEGTASGYAYMTPSAKNTDTTDKDKNYNPYEERVEEVKELTANIKREKVKQDLLESKGVQEEKMFEQTKPKKSSGGGSGAKIL